MKIKIIWLIVAVFGIVFLVNSNLKNIQTGGHSTLRQGEGNFSKSVSEAKSFYDLYGNALDQIKAGNDQEAINLLNNALQYVKLGPEIAMVHHQLAIIYKNRANFELEMSSLEKAAKYTANPQAKERDLQRIVEIQQFLAAKNPSTH